jgi:uncharacterized protein YukE
MRRPAGEPGTIAAAARGLGAAAGALREVRGRLRGATSFVVTAGAWQGPASQAFLADGVGSQAALDRAAQALDQAAGALSELAARLEQAQATWDRAQRLAATVGVDLARLGDDPSRPLRSQWNPNGGVRSPADAVDPTATLVAGRAVAMATEAEQAATAARRAAAAHLDQAAARVPSPSQGGRVPPVAGRQPGRDGGHDPAGERQEGPVREMVSRVLEVGAEAVAVTHHVAAAAEARVQAAGRLAATADDPAVRAAAARVVQGAGRSLVDGSALAFLPLVAPVMAFGASWSSGEPLPRALAGAVGGALGADLGSRAGMAACGGEAAATQGAGLIVCPTLSAVGGALGAEAGKAAALHVYDKIAGPPVRPEPATRPEPRPESGG